jgi:diadenosine tetraphosphatase ApaH/serine/threonine PP2A family protein phosphatase
MPATHHFLIAGARWVWRYSRLRGRAAGWAYLPNPNKPDEPSVRKVLIDSRLKGRTRMETEIHEALHVCFPQMSEEVITTSARDVSRILWFLGYRLQEDKQP